MKLDYERLAQLIKAHSGLTLDQSRISDIDAICGQFMASNNITTSTALLDLLEATPTSTFLWQQLLRRVTIGETYFFRNATHFNALQRVVLPEIIKQRREQGFLYLNIWSAGCSTGEEPYSIAMLLEEILDDIEDWNINILGTDINEQHLEIARAGHYRRNSFRTETRGHIQHNYFDYNDGDYIIHDNIKRRVTFSNLNLVTDAYPSFPTRTMHQDIILCRNVTIYFDEATTGKVVGRFFDSLKDGGYLIVGHAEPALVTYQAFETRNIDDAIMYRKSKIAVPEPFIAELQNTIQARTPKTAPAKSSKSRHQNAAKPQPKPVSKSQPKASPLDIVQVKAAINRSDWDVALSLLAIFEKQDPMNPEVHYLRGLVLMNSGSLDAARQSLRRSLYCDPTFALAHYAMAEVYFQQDDIAKANRCWMLSDRAVAGLEPDITLADDLTVGMLRDLILIRLNHTGEAIS